MENKSADNKVKKLWRGGISEPAATARLVRETARALTRTLQNRLAKNSIPVGHWYFLMALWEEDGLNQASLSRRAGVKEPTTYVALRAMETAGYVTRQTLNGNKKNVHIFLTPKGRKMERPLKRLARDVSKIAIKDLSDEEHRILRKALKKMLANLMEGEE